MNKRQVRQLFWESFGFNKEKEYKIKRLRPQKDFRTDVRCAFVDYIDNLSKNGEISEKTAFEITL